MLQGPGGVRQAEPLYREALEMRCALFPREKYPRGHPDLARSMNNLGFLLQGQGQYANAEPVFRDSLAMRRLLFSREVFPHGHPELAQGVHNLAFVLKAQGSVRPGGDACPRGAGPVLRLVSRGKYPRGHPQLATCLTGLATCSRRRGNMTRPKPSTAKPWRCAAPCSPGSSTRRVSPIWQRPWATWGPVAGAGEYARAARCSTKPWRCCAAHLLALADGSRRRKPSILSGTVPLTHDGYLGVTPTCPRPAAVYEEMWQRKALLSRILERRHLALLASNDLHAHKLGRQLAVARQHLAHLLLAPPRMQEEHARRMDKLTEDKEDLEKRLVQQLRLTARPQGPPPPQGPEQALPQDRLPGPDRYTDFEQDKTRPGKKGERRTPRYVAFILRPGQKKAERVELGPAPNRGVAGWRQAIVNNRPDRAAAARFARLAWEPLRKHLPAGLHTVYLSADHALTQVPWAALPGSKPGTVLSGGHRHRRCAARPLAARTTEAQAAAAQPQRPAAGRGRHRLWPRPRGGREGTGRGTVCGRRRWEAACPVEGTAGHGPRTRANRGPGPQALPPAAAQPLAVPPPAPASFSRICRVRYAHLATHGFFADAQFRSAFQVDENQYRFMHRGPAHGGGTQSADAVGSGAGRRQPLGQGSSGRPRHSDGGGVGGAASGRHGVGGAVGLRHGPGDSAWPAARASTACSAAFHLAGCKNVIASLWRVDDDATAALMAVFYRKLWVEKMPPLEALRQAQLYLYRNPSAMPALAKRRGDLFAEVDLPRETVKPGAAAKHAPTSQWAAFVLSGGGR